jgi:transposase InsO family protein
LLADGQVVDLDAPEADEVILHADRGCQFTSAPIAACTHRHSLARSVGRTGVCSDNAAAESVWAIGRIAVHIPHLRRSPIEGEGKARFAYRPRLNVD